MRWTGPALAAALAALLAACGDARPTASAKSSSGCSNCHGSAQNPAPPVALSGATATTEVGVGAHQLHLRDTPVRSAIPCNECHVVPTALNSPGHVDSPPPAEVTFGALATHAGTATPATPSWDRASARCSGVYCHGATLASGPAQGPVWTFAVEPDPGRAGVCTTCHGAPPALPHPQSSACWNCHPETVDANGAILVAGGKHIDGIVQPATVGCTTCHGSANPAPPRSVSGLAATTAVEVGAHQIHLRDTSVRRAVACSECHVVPAAVGDPGHVDAVQATVTFGTLATSKGATPTWDRNGPTCAGVYCHGARMASPPAQGPTWTFAAEPDPARPGICATCHGWPPPAPHAQLTGCSGCHPDTVVADGTNTTIDVAGGKHIDGILEVTVAGGCAGCHGYPPPTGAHAVHFGLAGAAGAGAYGDLAILQDRYPTSTPTTAPAVYAFGCGLCHPLDPAKHMDGTVEVEVYDAAAPAGSLKARAAPTAAYSGGLDGTCSGVYCHSSGQETPSWAKPYGGPAIASPAWTSGAALGCNGCHDNPPAYPSGGSGAPDANSHVNLADDGYEFGHFAGLPGPFHSSKHGGDWWGPAEDAAPITCQTCHSDTVDPANTGPSGFYYLDTGGTYQLPTGLLGYACASCHAAGDPAKPTGTGRILPLRHVNGAREVAFDARTAIAAIPWLPAAPNTPTRPYWVTNARTDGIVPGGAVLDGATMSLHLQGTTYDPASKTCSNAACHLEQTAVRWGRPYLYTGTPNSCGLCHCTLYGAGPCPPPP